MSITNLTAYKRRLAQRLEPNERKKLEALEAASLDNLNSEQIARIKRDTRLGTYPTARLVMAAYNRQTTELGREAAERRAEAEREARMRI